jgi:hypothetical protein
MSSFSQYRFDELLPPYLSSPNKDRLKKGLEQFVGNPLKSKALDYSDFFLSFPPNFLMQSDLFNSIKMVEWDSEIDDFSSGFIPAVLVSSTCDISNNSQSINKKEALFAPLISVSEYCIDLKNEGYSEDQISSFVNSLHNQEFSNIFYMPKNEKNNQDYLVFFDKISWFPTDKLIIHNSSIEELRFISLSNYGFYLFLLKLSYHFCRVPEESYRQEM